MNDSQVIQQLADQVIITQALTKNKEILDFFSELPRVLRKKIQTFHNSELPRLLCYECDNKFYTLSDENTCQGYLCKPCLDFYDNKY